MELRDDPSRPPHDTAAELLLGAVAYDPKVVTIWDGFRRWFATNGLDEGRQRRLVRIGFPHDEAAALSALHTRNFM